MYFATDSALALRFFLSTLGIAFLFSFGFPCDCVLLALAQKQSTSGPLQVRDETFEPIPRESIVTTQLNKIAEEQLEDKETTVTLIDTKANKITISEKTNEPEIGESSAAKVPQSITEKQSENERTEELHVLRLKKNPRAQKLNPKKVESPIPKTFQYMKEYTEKKEIEN
jgi:hypothetical protein